jgi:Trk-type K+ transport system membrane component
VQIPWFALFQSVSAFSNTGMSLADQSMVPFQTAYLMTARESALVRIISMGLPQRVRLTGAQLTPSHRFPDFCWQHRLSSVVSIPLVFLPELRIIANLVPACE